MMLFFERQKTARGEWPEVFVRDKFPQEVRTQCWQIFGNMNLEQVCKKLRMATGKYELNAHGRPKGYGAFSHDYNSEVNVFFHSGFDGGESDSDVEYAFTVLELMCKEYYFDSNKIDSVNYRLRLGGVGYKFVDGQLIPVDDEHLTRNAVIPAISLLNRGEFSSSYKYLHQAFLDYREGTSKSLESAVDNTLKASEALLKVILDSLNIEYGKATYMKLIQISKENGLFPDIADDKLNPLINNLKSLGEIRNQSGGHGAPNMNTSDRLVRLAINHATSNLLFIAETYLEEHKR